jgi:DinB superfamily
MTEFDAALARFAALDEDALGRPWSFGGQTMDVRYALFRTIEDAQEAHVRAVARPLPESRRILSLAQRAFGDLRGLLVGLPADLIDRAPRAGEWPVRHALGHMWLIERRYALQTLYAVERSDSDPVRIPDDRLPTPAQVDMAGEPGEALARLGAARAESNRRLGDIAPALMTRPTIWGRYDADVRFRLHRFAAHVIEHSIQCEKTLAALGWQPTEGRRIVRPLAALVGEIEGLGAVDEAREIERRLAERRASAIAP